MAYSRVLPQPINELSDEFIQLFFNFATTYTEESVLEFMLKRRKEEDESLNDDLMKELGYSEEDLLNMQ